MLEKAEALFHKLEEKLVALLSERDSLLHDKQRLAAEVQDARAEIQGLKTERELHAQKLNELVSLIESVNEPKAATAPVANTAEPHFSPSLAAIKPLLAQGQA